jgi:hypothetical protein
MSQQEREARLARSREISAKDEALSDAALIEAIRQNLARILTVAGRPLWNEYGLVLMTGLNSFWILYNAPGLSRYVGRQVIVEGNRVDFNGLEVRRYKLAEADWPVSLRTRIKHWLGKWMRSGWS